MSFTNPKPESVEKNALINVLHMALQDNDEHVIEWFTSKLQSYWPKFSDEIIKNAHNNIFYPEDDDESEDDGPNEDSKNLAADIQAKLNKAATEEKINMASGAEPTPTPRPLSNDDEWADDYNKKHEGFEKQAEGLDNLLEGLRDTPHDNRW